MEKEKILVSLSAVITTIDTGAPKLLLVKGDETAEPSLPSGSFIPVSHRSLEAGVKQWAFDQTGISLDYTEQLYTFGNRFRSLDAEQSGSRVLTISYMALTASKPPRQGATWMDWYRFFPWEDHRQGPPPVLDTILQLLDTWMQSAEDQILRKERADRVAIAFNRDHWNPELVLPRYELLYESGIVSESERDWTLYNPEQREELPISHPAVEEPFPALVHDSPMMEDHRRIAASALGRLRSKIKYRPLIFELLPPLFTLFQIQKSVEALSGVPLHKQNFRRLLLSSGLVAPSEQYHKSTSGRPAQLFSFAGEAVQEWVAMELRYPIKKKRS